MPLLRKINFKFWAAAIAVLLCCPCFLYANPQGASVVEGSATISVDAANPNILNINTASEKVVIDWNNFSIGASETVRFYQPSQNSMALNRVTGNNASDISGSLFANGIIILSNPNGINIGPSANINAAGFIASTLYINKNDFMAGNYNFYKVAGKVGYIVNKGRISTNVPGGYICLLSPAIDNQYIIEANLGTIVLASGERMTLALDDSNQISVVVAEAARDGLVGADGKKVAIRNSGTISADGGKVVLTAKVLNNVFDYSFNNSGVIRARSLTNHNGIVRLEAEGAPAINSGKIEAGEVQIEVKDSGFINKGEIITDGSAELPNGGRVAIEAMTILQQGIISANALEQGRAGTIEIISQDSAVLDDASTTEARALGLVGNGGRILIDSKGGNTVVNKNAVIDVSAGAISGNGGFIEVSAFDQLGFYGVLNGRAPPGYKPGTAILDPTDASIGLGTGESPSVFNINTTVWATRNITIDGNVTLASGITLNLYADHTSEVSTAWDDNTGNITRSGNYTITGASATLNLKAASGIGTSGTPIKTNVATLSTDNSASNDTYIDQGSTDLTVTSMVNSSSSGVLNLVAENDLIIGFISSDTVSVTSTSGSIDGLGTQSNNIEADDLSLRAGLNIGANYPLFINAVTFSAYADNGNIGAETSTKIGLVYDTAGTLLGDGAQVSVVGNDYAVTITTAGYFELKSVNLTQPVILKVTLNGYHTYYSFKSSTRAANNIYLYTNANYTGFLGLLTTFLIANGVTLDAAKGLIVGIMKDSAGNDLHGPGVAATLTDGVNPVSGITTAYYDPNAGIPTFYLVSQSTTSAFVIVNVPTGTDYTLSATKDGSTFNTYQVQAFTDGLTLGFVKSTDDTGLRIAIYSGNTTDTDSDGLPDSLETILGTDPTKADTDGDGLSDYEEYLKYRTNPLVADSDGDGINDGVWDDTHCERREYTYSIKVHGKILLHAVIADMNDFFQDARSLATSSYQFTDAHGNLVTLPELEYEAIIYSEAVQLLVPKVYPLSYSSDLNPYLQESATVTISPQMQAKVQEIINQIPADERTDLKVADTLLKWLKENSLDIMPSQYSASMLSEIVATEDGLRLKYQDSGNTYRDANGEQTFERYEIFSDQQFGSGKRGSCVSTAALFTGLFRAAGIPTRMVYLLPLMPNNDLQFYRDLINNGISNAALKSSLLAFLSQAGGVLNHFTAEAYINGQWVRMDQEGPEDVGIGSLLDGIPDIKIFDMVDYSDFALADYDGRLTQGKGPEWVSGDVKRLGYHVIALSDQDAIHTPSGTLPSKETASYNSPTVAILKAPVFLQSGIIVVNDATRSSVTINELQAKDIGAIVAGKDRSLVIDNFTLTGASNEAYIESATKGISMLDGDSRINVDSLELYAGDTVSLTGAIEDLYATTLIDLSSPALPKGAVHTFTVTDSSALDVTYLWHNNGNIQISSGSQALNADDIITYLDGSVTLTSEGASTIQNITSAGALTLAKTTTAATYTVGADTIDVGAALTINSGVTFTSSGATEINVGGNWVNSGTFNSGTSTVTFDGIAAGKTITANGAGSPFYNIAFSGSGGEWTLQDIMNVTGAFGVTGGKFISGFNTVNMQGASATYKNGDITVANTNWALGTLNIQSNTNQALPNGETYNNLQLGRYSGLGPTQYTMGSNSTIGGTWTIDSDANVMATVTGTFTANNKTYDGTTGAEINADSLSLSGIVNSQAVTLTKVLAFNSKNIGNGRVVSLTGSSLGGAQASYYTLSLGGAPTATADISQKSLDVTATGPSKECGTALTAGTSAANFTHSGEVAGEAVASVTLTPNAAGLSATTAADEAYVVTPSSATGSGGFLESNYQVTYNPYNGTVGKKEASIILCQATVNQLSNATLFRPLPPTSGQLGGHQFNFFNPMGPVYIYHPSISLDMSAFGALILDDAHRFIGGTTMMK